MLVDRWVTQDDDSTCDRCQALHGQTWPAGSEHPAPPLHDFCRCKIVTEDDETDGGFWSQPTMSQQHQLDTRLQFTRKADRIFAAQLIAAGDLRGHNLTISAETLARSLPAFEGLNCLLNHTAFFESPRVENVIGAWSNVRMQNDAIAAELHTKPTPAGDVAARLLDAVIDDARAGAPTLDIGVSLDCWVSISDAHEPAEITAIHHISSADLVFQPASDGARFTHILAQAGLLPAPTVTEAQPMTAQPLEATAQANEYLQAIAASALTAKLAASNLPPAACESLSQRFAGQSPTVADMDAAIAEQQRLIASLQPVISGHEPHRISLRTPDQDAQDIIDWMFGVKGAPLPEYGMRRPSDFYRALTGDIEWRGRYDQSHARFASATTTNLSDLAANAMNKVMVETWPALVAYRWYERLVTVTPNDGSVQAMSWVTFGGLANLPTVAEGAAYSEATVGDVSESDAFAKYGAYVGITEEMFRNDNLAKMQAVPRALAVAAVRTRSAKFAAIFTVASGTGPTLDQDTTVLFHSNHSNVATTALSAAAWEAARLECYKHTEVTSSKRLGVFPKFCLVPADLYDDALVFFGYGTGGGGYPGTGNNDTNPYGVGREVWDPRPEPIAVPDWTDANDWAYLVDPALHPVLMISYAQQPGGGQHAMPEIFSVTSPLAGLVFANDTLPVKVRDWYSYGVAGYRGIGKRNVA